MTRGLLLRMADSPRVERWVRRNAVSAGIVRRFVAGDTMEAAAETVRGLNARGILATLDFLGEHVSSPTEALRYVDYYRQLIEYVQSQGLDANISLKLTQLGLEISTDQTIANMSTVVSYAADCGQFIRIDMEGSVYTDRTFQVLDALRSHHDNVGIVVQSCLKRTQADVERLVASGCTVRLVKGAYQEPDTIAYQSAHEIRRSFVDCMSVLFRSGGYHAIATHDTGLVSAARQMAAAAGVATDGFEFQMLYGMSRQLQEELVADGYRVRVYTPFGTQWYSYLMRRMAERPQNLMFFARHLVRK